jgi:hypothetical protein
MDAGNLIEAYKKNNNLEYLMENDIDNMMIPEKIRVIVNDGAYRIFFKDGIYSSETKEVFFRPGP